MSEEEKKFPSIKEISKMVESIFCGNLFQTDESRKAECERLMELKREKKVELEELLAKLGLDREAYHEALQKAIKEAEERL
jgi:K+/H+ antiporter YhaU regulatory subunit KhtT